ncbi:hypothetical protein M426DRAFT_27521 [Hypoxylon sp. CI-4A]|nr:hypothetical protein M426DRAFT_27521 [Hypoxylon sp. CI-4A]
MANRNLHQNTLQGLPIDIKFYILEALHIESLPTLATTCSEFYGVYRRSSAFIIHKMVSGALGDLLPRAVIRWHALEISRAGMPPLTSHVPSRPRNTFNNPLMERVYQFGDTFLSPTSDIWQIARPQDINFRMAKEIITFHSVIERWTAKFFEWEMDSDDGGHTMFTVKPKAVTATEKRRVQAAFYASETTTGLIPFNTRLHEGRDLCFCMLWHYFSPWENRIAKSIDDFLTYEMLNMPLVFGSDQRSSFSAFKSRRATWLTRWGLRGLEYLSSFNGNQTRFAGPEDQAMEHLPIPFRGKRYYSADVKGGTWLMYHAVDTSLRYLQEIDHLLERFPEEETGARDAWYFSIVIKETDFEETDLDQELIDPFIEKSSWWDRARIDEYFPGIFGSIEETRALAEDTEYENGIIMHDGGHRDIYFCEEIGYCERHEEDGT